jgi:hypothetical protein
MVSLTAKYSIKYSRITRYAGSSCCISATAPFFVGCRLISYVRRRTGAVPSLPSTFIEPCQWSQYRKRAKRANDKGRGMSILRLPTLRLSETEKIIALVWQLLESENIPSPRMWVRMTESGSAQVSLVFASSADAKAVRAALRKSGHAFGVTETTNGRSVPEEHSI